MEDIWKEERRMKTRQLAAIKLKMAQTNKKSQKKEKEKKGCVVKAMNDSHISWDDNKELGEMKIKIK